MNIGMFLQAPGNKSCDNLMPIDLLSYQLFHNNPDNYYVNIIYPDNVASTVADQYNCQLM